MKYLPTFSKHEGQTLESVTSEYGHPIKFYDDGFGSLYVLSCLSAWGLRQTK